MELTSKYKQQRERGFGLLEVLISTSLLVVGLLGLLASFSVAVVTVGSGETELLAKEKAQEALESIYTARNTGQLSFDQIGPASKGGVFTEGFQKLTTAGSDGLVSTADDGETEKMSTAGEDRLMGTEDDQSRDLSLYERRVEILDLNSDLKEIRVTIHYTTSRGIEREYQVNSYVSRFR